MKLVIAVENATAMPNKPISGTKKVLRFSPKPSNIMEIGNI